MAKLSVKLSIPDRSGESKEYLLWVNHRWIKRRWSEMTLVQKIAEIKAEERAEYDQMFDPCGILF